MVTFTYTVQNAAGFHARPVTQLCSTARSFESEVFVQVGERASDGADLMGLMALDASQGDVMVLTAEGPDEQACLDALRKVCTF